MTSQAVILDHEIDWAGFRQAARRLLAAEVPPHAVNWLTRSDASQDLFADSGTPASDERTSTDNARHAVPASFVTLCESAILHSDPSRFGLLYRLLWRLIHEPLLRDDPLDADILQAQQFAKAVRRDMHKMTAFVRFRLVGDEGDGNAPLHAAWFEPSHHIVEATAPFFVRRFAQMRWAIFTPECSAHWNGSALEFGPGGQRDQAPGPDAGEALWLTYYRHIFNPARLKLAMMQKEMPRKYWRNLPEAESISMLVAQSAQRTHRMIEAPATQPARRIEVRASTRMNASHIPGELANPQTTLTTLREATNRCRECPLGEHATQSVFGEGPAKAALMVVGEQPGDQEDLQGRPFVGPSGKLFDRAVAQLGWQREQLYVTNAVKHFKYELRGKRRIHKTPAQREAAACLHWLESEIDQVQPKALIALGATAARSLLGRPVAVMSERGRWHVDARGRPVLVTLHPSALLRGEPAEQEHMFAQWLEDLSLAGSHLGIAVRPRASRTM